MLHIRHDHHDTPCVFILIHPDEASLNMTLVVLTIVSGGVVVRLVACRNTLESKKGSLASAIATFRWFVMFGDTGAWHVRTTVIPSICVSRGAVGWKSLSMYRSGRETGG